MALTLATLPVEMIYRILDHLDGKTIFLSLRNVCQRLNDITDTYRPYQVNYRFNFQVSFSSLLKFHHSFH